jgi:hypothetical protein
MRRAFTVATVFTGTAACAAAFAPAAGAVTAARDQPLEPATSHRNCAIGPRTTSTVFWWLPSAHHGPTCVGGANNYREVTFVSNSYSAFCAGNNSGYYVVGGEAHYYKPGETKASILGTYAGTYITSVSIYGWTGHDTCAT